MVADISCIPSSNRTQHSLNAERTMSDRRSGEKSLPELEFKDLNIHL